MNQLPMHRTQQFNLPLRGMVLVAALAACNALPMAIGQEEVASPAMRLAGAIDSGSVAAVRRVVDAGVDPNAPFQETLPLVRAIWAERVYVARLLCQSGAEVNAFDDDGCTPLVWGVESENVPLVDVLLAAGADVNLPEKLHGMSPLQVACGTGNQGMVDRLIAAKADVHHRDLHQGTCLEEAAFGGHRVVADKLRRHGLTTQWPLHVAAGLGDREEVVRLLDAGTAIEQATAGWGNTPLMFAAGGGQVEIASLLLDRGAQLDTTNSAGGTVLHVAAANGQLKLVRWLVDEQQFDPTVRDHDGFTPLDWARGKRVRSYLQSALKSQATRSVPKP